jgi:hypothetical protein
MDEECFIAYAFRQSTVYIFGNTAFGLYIDFQLDIWCHSQFQRPIRYMILQETWRDEDEKCFHDIDASTLFCERYTRTEYRTLLFFGLRNRAAMYLTSIESIQLLSHREMRAPRN